MKTLNNLALAALLLLTACAKDQMIEPIQSTEDLTTQPLTRNGGSGTYPANEMVVHYDFTLSEAQKQLLRNQYGVSSFKTCTCADPSLELWIFQLDRDGNLPGGLNLEETVIGAKDDSGLENAEVNPAFQHMGDKLNVSFGTESIGVALNNRVTTNENITIAVLDTGVDYNYFGFDSPFLYNSEDNPDTCGESGMQDLFGWDFVNQDNDPFDDYGHGTVISSLIFDELDEQQVDFQILPIKAFDENGMGNYFDILCGFKYAINNDDVDVINMSFGWYHNNYELFGRYVQESEGRAVLMTSAGNTTQNNDQQPHYPSSYDVSNIVSVTALSNDPANIELAYFSNFGTYSVDIAALGQGIPFYITPLEYIEVSGTSYSNALGSAFSGVQYAPGMTPEEHIQQIIANTIQHSNLSAIRYQSYIYY